MSEKGLNRLEDKRGIEKEGIIVTVRKNREGINLFSLIAGIILIFAGLGGLAITLPTPSPMIIAPVASLFLGAFFALMGGLRGW